jgi:hypothetical protein
MFNNVHKSLIKFICYMKVLKNKVKNYKNKTYIERKKNNVHE